MDFRIFQILLAAPDDPQLDSFIWTHPFRLSSYYGDAAVLTRPSRSCQARNINFTFPRRYVAAHIELSNLTPPRARDYAPSDSRTLLPEVAPSTPPSHSSP